MKILHIARRPSTGVWSVIESLILWQLEQGWQVGLGVMISSDWPDVYLQKLDNLEKKGLIVYRGSSLSGSWTKAYLWHSIVKNPVSVWAQSLATQTESKEVVVHFHNAWSSGVFLPISSVEHLTIHPVCTFHGITGAAKLTVQPFRRIIHRYWAQRLVKHDVSLVSVDSNSVFIAKNLFGIPPELFTVIPNGVSEPPINTDRPFLSECNRPFTVGHVATISDGKGWRFTAQAVEQLYQEGYIVHLMLAGAGQETEEAKNWCSQRNDFATFLGYVDDPRQSVFPNLDVLVNPSTSEGLPMSLLEAFSAGVPVLATPVGGVPQALREGQNGFFIERNPVMIATILRKLITDKLLFQQLCQKARQTYVQEYTVEKMGRQYESIYTRGTRSYK